tara:strand:+ start:3020 stop:3235 length:216 start_codon:yes stop_codon:yes gene_type:complete
MNFQKVEISNIEAIAHEGDELQVRFKTGAVYEYKNVESSLHHEIVNADSVGSAFNRLVKTNPERYPFRRLN